MIFSNNLIDHFIALMLYHSGFKSLLELPWGTHQQQIT